jgi:hypothetical protein
VPRPRSHQHLQLPLLPCMTTSRSQTQLDSVRTWREDRLPGRACPDARSRRTRAVRRPTSGRSLFGDGASVAAPPSRGAGVPKRACGRCNIRSWKQTSAGWSGTRSSPNGGPPSPAHQPYVYIGSRLPSARPTAGPPRATRLRSATCDAVGIRPGASLYLSAPWRGWMLARQRRGWWEVLVNELGCVLVGASAIAGFVVSSAGRV